MLSIGGGGRASASVIAALISSFVAGYFPARKAAGGQPVEIIRGAA